MQAKKIYPDLPIQFGCCNGDCGTCAIKVLEGQDHLSKKTKQEEITLTRMKASHHTRLACQCAILGNIVLE